MNIPAGNFSTWLRETREALRNGTETNVPCGDCTACCRSSYFIHIRPEEKRTLERMGPDALIPAAGMAAGNMLLGYDKNGQCPKLVKSQCTVYADRPQTCRNYDCRVFAAAGITAGENKPLINLRVADWRFDLSTHRDLEEQVAVKSAAIFIRENASAFPGGRVPTDPSQLAVLAIKVYELFLADNQLGKSAQEIAIAIVEAAKPRSTSPIL